MYLAGSHLQPVTFSDGTQPGLLGKMPWHKYSEFIRAVDLGLCLMYAPTPSYPPLDLAASGGVALTNTFASKANPDYSKNIVWAPADRVRLAEGLCRAAALAVDPDQRSRNYKENRLCRAWQESYAEILERLPARLGIE